MNPAKTNPLLICVLIILAALAYPPKAFSQNVAVDHGVAWIMANQNNIDGTWGTGSTRETAIVVDALKELGQTGPGYNEGLSYLTSTTQICTDYLSRKIVSTAEAGQLDQGDITNLLSIQNPDGGFGFAKDWPSSVSDSLNAAEGLLRAGVTDQKVEGPLLGYITRNQNTDGSFSCVRDESNLYLTACAVVALSDFLPRYAGLKSNIDNAVSFITTTAIDLQNTLSFVSHAASPVVTTALAVRALVASGGDAAQLLHARNYLLAEQQDDGSWEEDPVTTALALQALAGTASADLPNLSIDPASIFISPTNPGNGQTVHISAIVRNTGAVASAMQTRAKFYLGSIGGVMLGTAEVGQLQIGAAQQVFWSGQYSGTGGENTIFIVINENNEDFAETTYSDNTATKTCITSTKPDLAINPVDITFSNNSPLQNEPFEVDAYIHNFGESSIGTVTVALYEGAPNGSGNELSRLTFPGIAGGGVGRAAFKISLPAGYHALFISVDPDNAIVEQTKSNNISSKNLTVGPAGGLQGIDLVVESSEIIFSSQNPRQGEPFIITSRIRNSGTQKATDVHVSAYAINTQGEKITFGSNASMLVSSIAAGGAADVTFSCASLVLTAGIYEIHVYADDNYVIIETNENNNDGYQMLTVPAVVNGKTGLDLAVDPEITFEPAQPVVGESVTMRCGVTNAGVLEIDNAQIGIYEDAEGSNGSVRNLLAPKISVPYLAPGRTAWITVNLNTAGWAGSHAFYVIADPDDLIREDDETNNLVRKNLTLLETVDFAVTQSDIKVLPGTPAVDDNMSIAVRVYNRGMMTAAADIALYNGDPRGQAERIEIAQGESINGGGFLDLMFSNIDAARFAATQRLCVAVNPEQGTTDEDGSNDIACIPLKVPAPDLVFESIQTDPPKPVSGDDFTVTAVVHNIGGIAADTVQVALYQSSPTEGHVPFATGEILHLDAGSSATVKLNRPLSLPEGSYTLYLIVDPPYTINGKQYSHIPELNESNNNATIIVAVAPPPCPSGIKTFYRDFDGDGSGDAALSIQACSAPEGYVENSLDCDDSNSAIRPGAVESYNDCNTFSRGDRGTQDICGVGSPIQKGAQWLQTHRSTTGAWPPYDSLINNAFVLRLLALTDSRDIDTAKYDLLKQRIYETQALDGSWVSVAATAGTIIALIEDGEPKDSPVIINAVNWLLKNRNSNVDSSNYGSWSGGYVKDTGLAVVALVAAGVQPQSEYVQAAANWLILVRNGQFWGSYPGLKPGLDCSWYPVEALILANASQDIINSAAESAMSLACGFQLITGDATSLMLYYYTRHDRWYSPCNVQSFINYLTTNQLTSTDVNGAWAWYGNDVSRAEVFNTAECAIALWKMKEIGMAIPDTVITNAITYCLSRMINTGDLPVAGENSFSSAYATLALQKSYPNGFRVEKQKAIARFIATQHSCDSPGANCNDGPGSWFSTLTTDPSQWSGLVGTVPPIMQALISLYPQFPGTGIANAINKARTFLISSKNSQQLWPTWRSDVWISDFDTTCDSISALLDYDASPLYGTGSLDPATYGIQLNWILSQKKTDISGNINWSTVGSTPLAIIALSKADKVYGITTYKSVVDSAVVWLKGQQSSDGSYYGSISATAWALIALSEAGDFSSPEMLKSIEWLRAVQNMDAGWPAKPIPESDTADTALATWALAVSQCHADIGLDITFDKAEYLPGDVVTMRVTSKNVPAGLMHLSSTVLGPDGKPSTVVFQKSGNGFVCTYELSSASIAGVYTVSVMAQNGAYTGFADGIFAIRIPPTYLPDLSITPDKITFSTSTYNEGETLTITAKVVNAGLQIAAGVKVICYDGDPDKNTSKSIGERYLGSLGVNQAANVQFAWPETQGAHNIYVDITTASKEMSLDNNRAFKNINVTPQYAGLWIASMSLLPQVSVVEGTLLTITTRIINSGLRDAQNVEVAFYDGDPKIESHLIGLQTIDQVRINETVPATFMWRAKPPATHQLYCRVDPYNKIPELWDGQAQTNYLDVYVDSQPTPDFTVDGIGFTPNTFREGEPVTITARVSNRGNRNAEGVVVACYDGNPASGGILIGEKTIGLLNMNSAGIDNGVDVPFVWRADGLIHLVSVLIDPDNNIAENNEKNNSAFRYTLSQQPDLFVSPDYIAYQPQKPMAGGAATITAVVRNLGQSVNAGVVRFLDSETGQYVDKSIQGGIAAGGSASISAILNGLTPSGRHFIHVIADPGNVIAEVLENNNEAIIAVDVDEQIQPTQPNLTFAPAGITCSPAYPREADQVTISAAITNLGTPAGGFYVRFYDVFGGTRTEIGNTYVYETLNIGQTITVSAVWGALDKKTGDHTVTAVIDPEHTITELTRDDNTASAHLIIGQSGLSVAVNQLIYNDVTGAVAVSATITDSGSVQRSLTLEAIVKDAAGNTISAPQVPQPVSIPHPPGTTSSMLTCPLNFRAAGSYVVTALVRDSGVVRAAVSKAFTIGPDMALTARVTADKAVYDAHETVAISSLVQSLSNNYTFSGLQADIRLSDTAGKILREESFPIDQLMPLQSLEFNSFWTTGIEATGIYTVQLTVTGGGIAEVTSVATFTIEFSTIGSRALQGSVRMDPVQAHTGASVTINYSVMNKSNADIIDLPLTLSVLRASDRGIIDEFTDVQSLAIGGTYIGARQLNTAGYQSGSYIVALSAQSGGTQQIIGYASFALANQCPTAVAGTVSYQPATVQNPVRLDGSSSNDPDGDHISYSWNLDRPEGSVAAIDDPASAAPSFTPEKKGQYLATLTVSDGACSASTAVGVTVVNRAPNADAGPDQPNRHVGDVITLNAGGSSDPDGDEIVAWQWEFDPPLPDGSAAQLSNPDNRTISFIVDKKGQYRIRLKVYDGTDWSGYGQVEVTAENRCPVAEAGDSRLANIGEATMVSGSGSYDPDGDPTSYRWALVEKPSESEVGLDNETRRECVIIPDNRGDYVLELIVNDGTCDSATDRVIVSTENRPPVADAGQDQAGLVGDTVTLSSGGSHDPDGDSIVGWQWEFAEKPAGSTAELSSPDHETTFFTIDRKGEYRIWLKVFDGLAWSRSDEVVVTTGNRCPVAVAAAAQTAHKGQAVQVDGSASSDPDNDPMTYHWVLNAPEQSAARLDGDTGPQPSFTPDVAGEYVAILTINDGTCDSEVSRVRVIVENRCPVASAGNDQTAVMGQKVELEGSGIDPDGDQISYSWSLAKPNGSAAVIDDPSSAAPGFTPYTKGIYTATVGVSDGACSSSAAVQITVENRCPTAHIDYISSATTGKPVQLDGSGSSDPDGDSLSYAWEMQNPTGSIATLDTQTSQKPSFTPDIAGVYTVMLAVDDGACTASAKSVDITVIAVSTTSIIPTSTTTLTTTVMPATTSVSTTTTSKPTTTSTSLFSTTTTSVAATTTTEVITTTTMSSTTSVMPDCDDIPVPGPACAMKIDYGTGGVSGDYQINSYSDYGKYVSSNYGYKNGKYKNLKIAGSITMTKGDLVMHSPGAIAVGKNIKLRATDGSICIDGRMGVTTDLVYLDSEQVSILSQEGDVSLGKGAQVDSGGLFISAGDSAMLEENVLAEIDGPVTMLSAGESPSAMVSIKRGAILWGESLIMRGPGAVQVSEFTGLHIDGPMRMVSTGSGSGSPVWVKYGAAMHADTLCLSGPEEVSVGPGSIIDVSTVSIYSTGAGAVSKAAVKSATIVNTADMVLSGAKAWLEPLSVLLIRHSLYMNAVLPNGCSAKGYYRAEILSGNCLE